MNLMEYNAVAFAQEIGADRHGFHDAARRAQSALSAA